MGTRRIAFCVKREWRGNGLPSWVFQGEGDENLTSHSSQPFPFEDTWGQSESLA